MKKHGLALVLSLFMLASGTVLAQTKTASHSFGIGLFLGQPTGIISPFGLSWRPLTVPLGIYLEIGLGMQLFPAARFQGSGGLGIQ